MVYRNIVVGVSDAPTSQIAGRHAFELAALSDATVHVVTAVEDPKITTLELGEKFPINDLETAREHVEAFVRSLSPKVPWSVTAADGKAGDALVDIAEQVNADLIVVGNVRMQGFGRILGSVGNDVSHRAPCSVLIVKTV